MSLGSVPVPEGRADRYVPSRPRTSTLGSGLPIWGGPMAVLGLSVGGTVVGTFGRGVDIPPDGY